jgi:hypothetical protein
MRRTLALLLALPVALVTLTAWDTGATTERAALSSAPVAQVTPVPTAAPPTEVDPVDAGNDGARPVTDDAVTTEDAVTTADAEGTVAEDGTSAQGPEVGPPPPPRAERTGPVEATFLIASVPEAGAVAGTGRRWRYTIEVEPGLGIDPEALATEVRAALHDERSWARSRTLEQVGDPAQARIRVVLASPETVDELCGRVGLRTAGIYSCWNGRFAALNGWRWEVGAEGFPDITTYRNYLVNHEFGHGLGYGHVGCPAAGAPAPVMMQQSKGLADCVANGWPYP